MFDTTQEISLTLPSPEGDKHVVVTFPTDEQLIERMRRTKTVVRSLGRGKSTAEPQPNEQNDADLLAKIKVSGDDLDPYEASLVINRLTRSRVVDSCRDGNKFVVTLNVPGAKTIHTLRIPSAKQVQAYSRNVMSIIDGRHGVQEMRLNLQASADLYDAVVDKTEGYSGPVPVNHKSDVVSEVIALLNQDQDDSDIEGF